MYFLNGDRLYIEPGKSNASFDEQLSDCLDKVSLINGGKRIFKLNFFADIPSDEFYNEFSSKIYDLVRDKFRTPVVTGIISQPPVNCRILVEAFYYDPSLWAPVLIDEGCGQAMLFRRENAEVLIGNAQASVHKFCRPNAVSAMTCLGKLLDKVHLPVSSVIRQWNYIENILGYDEGFQRYQEYNNVRSDFYADHFNMSGFPAATGIGMNRGGVIIEFVAVNHGTAASLPLDNPNQVAAHSYSNDVLVGGKSFEKYSPKFERARYLELFDKKLIFISGTASIRGEKTIGTGNPARQTRVTIENIRKLYAPEVLSGISKENLQPKYGHARVYLKNINDYEVIRKIFRRTFGNLPVVYLVADICRDDLLVEIEGKVILD
jgi:hypothetical protein